MNQQRRAFGRSVRNDVQWIRWIWIRAGGEITIRYEYRASLVRLGIIPRDYPRPNVLDRRERAQGFGTEVIVTALVLERKGRRGDTETRRQDWKSDQCSPRRRVSLSLRPIQRRLSLNRTVAGRPGSRTSL